jgi:SAM-dependent methyltransferase
MVDATAVAQLSGLTPRAEPRLVLTSCPLCGHDEAEPVAVGHDFGHRTTREAFLASGCPGCGLIYLNPRPASEDRPGLYPAADRWPERVAEKLVRRALGGRRPLPPEARVLLVTPGANLRLHEIRLAGARKWVLESVTWPSLKSRAGAYDAVLLLHALECCEAPLEEIASLRRLLRPGGRLVIVTENVDSVVGSLFRGRHWAGYDFPRHLSLFGHRALGHLAGEAGLEVERITTIASSVAWVVSVANLVNDWDVPTWLVRRVGPQSVLLGGLAWLVDQACRLRGRGARLEAVLRVAGDARE